MGLQVKRSPPPLRFGKREWKRMDADAARWGRHWVVASVSPDGAVTILDPDRARHGREIRLGADAAIDNVLRWLDSK